MAKNYRASLRKSGASGKKKAPTVFPSARTPALRHNEGAPLSTSSQPCNSTALAPRSFRFPYMTYLLRISIPMAGVAQRLRSRFGHFLALTVPSAVGFAPLPSMLRPDGNPPLQHAATRRHRTQTMQFLPISGIFLSQSIVLCERIRKPSIHAGLRTFIFKIAGSGNAY